MSPLCEVIVGRKIDMQGADCMGSVCKESGLGAWSNLRRPLGRYAEETGQTKGEIIRKGKRKGPKHNKENIKRDYFCCYASGGGRGRSGPH